MRHHTGSGRRSVIPPDWQTHHAGVAEGAMPGTVALRIPGTTSSWSDALEQNVTTPNAAYETTTCRVLALIGEARVVNLAEDEETIADYLIAVPRTVDAVTESHLARVSNTGDPALDGRTLRVVRVARGTHRFERDLFCTLSD